MARPEPPGKADLGAFLAPLIVAACVVLLGQCLWSNSFEPAGVGSKADEGYAAGREITDALYGWRRAHGSFPGALQELVPEDFKALPTGPQNRPFEYRRTAVGFELTFLYDGPGKNWCTVTAEKGWVCGGLL